MDGGGTVAPPQLQQHTLVEAALEVLNEPDPVEKARLGEAAANQWLCGDISFSYHSHLSPPKPPTRPARLSNMKLLAPNKMPKLGKARSLQSRQAIVHSLVHTESWAIDLSWDIIARFGQQEGMPREFFDDFVQVAQEEGRHFTLLSARLRELGSFYGALPAHDGLWDSAIETSSDLLSRLAVEHCVHEARGLDVLPTTISRFRSGGDEETAKLLETIIYPEEITHCAAGIRWFKYLFLRNPDKYLRSEHLQCCSLADSQREPVANGKDILFTLDTLQNADDELMVRKFHSIIRQHFHGPLKPPFNAEARKAAGFGLEWYEPLAVKEVTMTE